MAKKHIEENEKPVRYVLYVRKSTTDEDSQVKSLPDQIKVCREFADRSGLKIVAVVKESESAKKPATFDTRASKGKTKKPIRPNFVQMIRDIRAGKYDGIIAYHPDRLARNSLDSGTIVEMLDDELRDLKFPTCQFTNDASGKLLLNILFAMSKEYSEHLSENVQRGVDSNLEEGKSAGVYKWGYIRNEITGHYEKDPTIFAHMRHGWEMMLDGNTQAEVIEYWVENDVHHYTKDKKNPKKITLSTPQQASKYFQDPFAYGILCQAGQEVDLRELNPDFVPLITETEYDTVQNMTEYRARRYKAQDKKRLTYIPLQRFVACGACGKKMQGGKSRSKGGTYYLYYRCDNPNCTSTRKPKNVRASVIFDDLYKKLKKLHFTAKDYNKYSNGIDQHTEEITADLRIKYHSKQGRLNSLNGELKVEMKNYEKLATNDKTPKMVLENLTAKIEDKSVAVNELRSEVEEIKAKLQKPEMIKMTKEEFLNLANTAVDKMKAGTAVQKDYLCRILLLNITLNNKNVPSYLWKEPFATLMKSRKITSGGRDGT